MLGVGKDSKVFCHNLLIPVVLLDSNHSTTIGQIFDAKKRKT
ncbi:hypothetical protein DYY67_1661 [Candidatus Nitrosotalea sp. TS]|nr:hypothetical protein [Candidatus Nitrosotalea sp. TS]